MFKRLSILLGLTVCATTAHGAGLPVPTVEYSADRVIDALEEGGVEESALVLEVIPPFEQEDESVLADLEESVDYWREALARRGALAG